MELEGSFFNIADFEILETQLGKGTFGEVFLARNLKNKKLYAAKILKSESGFDGQQQMILLRECSILRRLNHPSIVKFQGVNFQSFSNPSQLEPTIITEYIPNGSPKNLLDDKRGKPRDPIWTFTKKYIALLGISNALRYLHEHGILHRDLKSQNILLDENYHPRICDFGLSRCFPEELTKSMKLTMSGGIGTPVYMAPEILEDCEGRYGPTIDVYAFAIVAYEIITGKEPYSELGKITPFKLCSRVIDGYRPQFTDEVPAEIAELIRRCWSQEAGDRPSFSEIYDELSGDISYLKGKVNLKEVTEFIEKLEQGKDEDYKKDRMNHLESNVSKLEEENDRLKNELEKVKSNQPGIDELFNQIGMKYNQGEGVKRDYTKANEYFQKAADLGLPVAFYNLGYNYSKGRGFKKDFKKAIEYYQKAAEKNYRDAFNKLGSIYAEGRGVERDYIKANEYYQKAADLGLPIAFHNLGFSYEEGNGFKRDYEKANEYYQKAADLGLPVAFYNLGYNYEKGKGFKQDYSKAIEYYQKAADLNCPYAFNELGFLFIRGRGVEQDFKKANEYYQKAADMGLPVAFFTLGHNYANGKGFKQDFIKANEYFKKAADFGVPAAFYNLACNYEEGKGFKQDYTKAIEYYQKASQLGYKNADSKLAELQKKKK
ncbi:hypothetical protein M9Y10_020785 [Tritrichomonas musculus]|uniref:Protein kinase domain-containing protein n=1 Tax=Tritrichomonas musculus TaxID=1915356 RepID=A0ABR2HFR9_9EUKA